MVKTKDRKNGSGEFTKGEQCRLIREHQGLNQTEFGQSLGVSRNTVSGWETGKYKPSNRHWRAIRELPEKRE